MFTTSDIFGHTLDLKKECVYSGGLLVERPIGLVLYAHWDALDLNVVSP